jgi:transcriptional regulator with XRE-family HTH domain
MRVLRRRLGLTQRELAFLVGYESDSQVSHIENGSRVPHLAEVLVLELVFGVPAVTVFPEIRQAVGHKIRARAQLLLSDLEKSSISGTPRISYKTAQLENVLASLRSRDGFDQGDPYL